MAHPDRHDPAWPPFSPVPTGPPRASYHRGVAPVGHRGAPEHRPDQTREYGTADGGWESSGQPRPPVRFQLRQLRRGGEWSWIGGLFAFVSWGIWLISVRGGDMVVPVLAFVLVLLVALGVFTLSRAVGRLVLERGLGRVRRSAWAAHLATGLFLAGAGVAYLGQTQWVVDVWNWVRGLS
ncbi:MAG TPA: hypothetical protein VFT95_04385 [Micromonosporaceae bacterium]|nr:hypothetical protein [Micromonosporaceae bacterium]